VDIHILKLRKKIETLSGGITLIQTVRGEGFRLEMEQETTHKLSSAVFVLRCQFRWPILFLRTYRSLGTGRTERTAIFCGQAVRRHARGACRAYSTRRKTSGGRLQLYYLSAFRPLSALISSARAVYPGYFQNNPDGSFQNASGETEQSALDEGQRGGCAAQYDQYELNTLNMATNPEELETPPLGKTSQIQKEESASLRKIPGVSRLQQQKNPQRPGTPVQNITVEQVLQIAQADQKQQLMEEIGQEWAKPGSKKEQAASMPMREAIRLKGRSPMKWRDKQKVSSLFTLKSAYGIGAPER
jgi:hypothetical protein